LINNVCCPSDVAPGYAPSGWSLVSVATVGTVDSPDLESKARSELEHWFGDAVQTWRHLRTYHLPKSLPAQPPGSPSGEAFELREGVYHCGDAHTSASIEGTIISGQSTAAAILEQAT
jgi:predicted NAD/FAD-dependent oxidoreductase